MDSRVVHSHVEEENDAPQQVILGAEENHSSDHEKKSVLNKVKAKAKKIKHTIKKQGQQVLDHGNGHNNEIQHTPDDVDLDEDKQLVQDAQDHQAPRSGEIKERTSLEESLERMNVHDEPKPTTEPKIQPLVADSTEYPPSGSHDIDQFVPHLSDATETQNEYPRETVSENINRNKVIPSETGETFNTITNTVEKEPCYEEPVETQPKQKSYTDEIEISSAEDADKTLPHENEEVSKLGNDEKVEHQKSESGKNVGYSLTEKLAPVYGKVAEVGSAVKSKVYGTNDGTETKNGDKGVTVKDYLAEKLKPSEEDRALSEVISETLHKGKEEPLKKVDGKLDSEVEKSDKVFEESNVVSPGKGMVDKVKDAVGSWFVKSPQGGGNGEDLSKNKKSVGEVEQAMDEGGKQE